MGGGPKGVEGSESSLDGLWIRSRSFDSDSLMCSTTWMVALGGVIRVRPTVIHPVGLAEVVRA